MPLQKADQYCTWKGTWQMPEASDQHKEYNSTLWANSGNFIHKNPKATFNVL
jgi:hypothetical protein